MFDRVLKASDQVFKKLDDTLQITKSERLRKYEQLDQRAMDALRKKYGDEAVVELVHTMEAERLHQKAGEVKDA